MQMFRNLKVQVVSSCTERNPIILFVIYILAGVILVKSRL